MASSTDQPCSGNTRMLEDLLDPDKRDEVVAQYKAKGRGGERYGVVCPNQNCWKRICPQGWALAQEFPDEYCQCRENYEAGEHETIRDILAAHGLPPRELNVKVNMREASPMKKKKKKSGKTIGMLARRIKEERQ